MSEYEDLTRRLGTALQDSISADLNGASENEVQKLTKCFTALIYVSHCRDMSHVSPDKEKSRSSQRPGKRVGF